MSTLSEEIRKVASMGLSGLYLQPIAVKVEAVQAENERLLMLLQVTALPALGAASHAANDYNCQDWPPDTQCLGCKGADMRDEAIRIIEATLKAKETA